MLMVLRASAVKPAIEAKDFGTRISFGMSPTFWQRVQLLVLGVDGVDREPFGIEQLEDAVLERHQNVRDRLRRIDLIRDRRELLPVLELPLERRGRGLHGHFKRIAPGCVTRYSLLVTRGTEVK